ncbi:hypothetical protein KAI46_06435 [bacterium]|nr:hypothetical protein [bacterium]
MATIKNKKVVPSKNTIHFHPNHGLPNSWIDNFNLGVRDDGVCLLRFATSLPEGHFEQSRILTSKDKLKMFADLICNTLDYFPVKEKKSKK